MTAAARASLMPEPSPVGRYERALRRNVAISALGLVAKLSHVVSLFVLTWLFGPSTTGWFLLGFGLYEICSSIAITGFTDATTVLASRHADGQERPLETFHRVLVTALLGATGIALALAFAVTVTGGALVSLLGDEYRAVSAGLPILARALVPTAIGRVCLAAMTASLRLEWEVLFGGLAAPLGLLAGMVVVKATGGGVVGIFSALLVTQCAIAVAALWVLHRRVGLGPALVGLRRPHLHIDGALVRFAIPQGLNMAATTCVARVDVLMLAGFGVSPALIGWYGTAATLAMQLPQLRMMFSTALAPIVARQHARGETGAIDDVLSRTARWVATLAVPAALAFVVLRDDLLGLFSADYRDRDSLFAAILVVGPFVNCLGGLAGNFLVYLLHNRWNLGNAVFAALLHVCLNWLLIPRWGLVGAAVATSVAMVTVTLLETAELAWLEKVHIRARAVIAPFAGLLASGLALALLWDPADLSFPLRYGAAAGLVGCFLLITRLLGHTRRLTR